MASNKVQLPKGGLLKGRGLNREGAGGDFYGTCKKNNHLTVVVQRTQAHEQTTLVSNIRICMEPDR